MARNHLLPLLIGLVILFCGCSGEGGTNTNTFEVNTEPSVGTLALRFNQPFPDGVDALRISGFSEEEEEHDHREAIQAQDEHDHEDEHEALLLVFGPETRSAVTDIDLTGVPTNVVHVEIEYLAGEEVVGHSEVDVELTHGSTYVIQNPEIELEDEHEDEDHHDEEKGT